MLFSYTYIKIRKNIKKPKFFRKETFFQALPLPKYKSPLEETINAPLTAAGKVDTGDKVRVFELVILLYYVIQ